MPREGLTLLEPIIKMADDKSACVKSETKQVYFELKLNLKFTYSLAPNVPNENEFSPRCFFLIIIFA